MTVFLAVKAMFQLIKSKLMLMIRLNHYFSLGFALQILLLTSFSCQKADHKPSVCQLSSLTALITALLDTAHDYINAMA